MIYKGEEIPVNKISRKIPLFMELAATKVKKNKKHKVVYQCGAVKVKCKIKGKVYEPLACCDQKEDWRLLLAIDPIAKRRHSRCY